MKAKPKPPDVSNDELGSRFFSTRELAFPFQADYRFRLTSRGPAFTLTHEGLRTLRLLDRLYGMSRENPRISWAVSGRHLIREIVRLEHTPVLSLVIKRAPNEDLQRIAVWLRGRCGGAIGTSCLSLLTTHNDFKLRKEVARTLVRLKAWHLVRRMLDTESNPRIRALLNPPARNYGHRMRKFTQCVNSRRVELPTDWFFLDAGVTLDRPIPPKPIELIRMLLQRNKKALANRV